MDNFSVVVMTFSPDDRFDDAELVGWAHHNTILPRSRPFRYPIGRFRRAVLRPLHHREIL
jgi:hypothetical protein